MHKIINNDWQDVLQSEFDKPYYSQLHEFLKEEYSTQKIHPDMENIFQAYQWTSFSDTKVVILGQDPYHGENQAIGLSFSVAPECKLPPSLKNIYKELDNDLGYPPVEHGYLKSWADQGVLMLNTVLTVREHQPNSHRGHGWEQLTDATISKLSDRGHVIFVLWGNSAKEKISIIDENKNKIITSTHPSPFSAHRGFLGSKPFSKINELLVEYNMKTVNWKLPNKI
ncbi:uracil-DNA glycosylase [Companilactobacillus sp. RD055328]|uniref:uracil-DNA glycosylase n=1 Tax=Companilactobacillus sp. RD055328 TaxID=2916634 RepID=UPI001FC7F798|nr:uracil-DNA glycosylase [Companilactobacillus sp. RD055328]GKQ43012.1 uracil-DNA glycosylase [Companilactobacillus sp. RD055328]